MDYDQIFGIPRIIEKFNDTYINDVNGWAFSKKTLKSNIGKLLTLDIDFGNKCSLNCPHCFRKDNPVDDISSIWLSFNDIKDYILEAKSLGLKSVKFLGRGEPFEDSNLISFLQFLYDNDIIPLIFTKGHVIGDDKLIEKIFSHCGIYNSEQLLDKIYDLNASILLGCNSLDHIIQDRMVGNITGYTQKMVSALRLLIKKGFNQGNPTRLCITTNPLTRSNYKSVLEIYKEARLRNIYAIVTPSMISGRAGKNQLYKSITPSRDELILLYANILDFNIKHGIQSLDQIKEEGIAAYAGGHPCNQIACGMYVTLNGEVLRCPGDDTTILGDIRKKSLKDIWIESENYGRSGTFNCGCPPKWGKSIPYGLFTDVLLNVIERS